MPMDHLYDKMARYQPPQKNQKLPQNTNIFFQPMSDTYTLMVLLAHSWLEIIEFSQILSVPVFWHWKYAALSESCQISVKRGNTFYLFVLNQIWLFVERKSGVLLRSLTTKNIRHSC